MIQNEMCECGYNQFDMNGNCIACKIMGGPNIRQKPPAPDTVSPKESKNECPNQDAHDMPQFPDTCSLCTLPESPSWEEKLRKQFSPFIVYRIEKPVVGLGEIVDISVGQLEHSEKELIDFIRQEISSAILAERKRVEEVCCTTCKEMILLKYGNTNK